MRLWEFTNTLDSAARSLALHLKQKLGDHPRAEIKVDSLVSMLNNMGVAANRDLLFKIADSNNPLGQMITDVGEDTVVIDLEPPVEPEFDPADLDLDDAGDDPFDDAEPVAGGPTMDDVDGDEPDLSAAVKSPENTVKTMAKSALSRRI